MGKKLLAISSLVLPSAGVGDEGVEISGGAIDFSNLKADDSLRQRLSENIERVSAIYEEALESSNYPGRLFICFDRIDEAWDEESVDSAKRLISGLVVAADGITSRFKGLVRPIVFLREDIFQELAINDRNKLKYDCGELLAWSTDTLARLLLERVNYFASRSGAANFSRMEDIFDKEQMRQGRNPKDYIIMRTMMRPRDLIQFMAASATSMKARRDDMFEPTVVNSQRLECQSVYDAERHCCRTRR